MKKVLLAALILSAVLGIYADAVLLPSMILVPAQKDADFRILNELRNEAGINVLFDSLMSADGLTLQTATLLPDSAIGTVLMLHGVGSSKGALSPMAKWLHDEGWQVLLVDQRAHGKSEGKWCTYGAKEKYDVKQLVDFAIENNMPSPIGVWGISMGGSVATLALALEQRLEFGIIQSTFTDMQLIVRDYQTNTIGFAAPWLADRALHRAGKKGGFEPDSIKPIVAAASIFQPVFVSHGDADEDIAFSYGEQLFGAIPSADKTWHPVIGADHLNWWEVGGDSYKKALSSFLRNIKKGEVGTDI